MIVENISIKDKIQFFNVLIDDICKNYDSILKMTCSKILSYANKIWKKTIRNSNFIWTKKDFLSHIMLIQDQKYSLFLNYVLGKFMEENIFV